MKFLLVSMMVFAGTAIAQEMTPTPEVVPTVEATPTVAVTPTIVTPTMPACRAVQLCVDQAVPAAIAQCMTANPGCTSKKH